MKIVIVNGSPRKGNTAAAKAVMHVSVIRAVLQMMTQIQQSIRLHQLI